MSQPRVIALESSHNICNGRVLKLDFIKEVKKIANKHKLRFHLDGARALNAAVALNIDPAVMVEDFDTVNFCLSKGMGCPVGSLVLGTKQDIEFARVIRKMVGGAMRQAGVLATCGLVSLEDWKQKLKVDNDNALWLAKEMAPIKHINVDPSVVETNIFRFTLKETALAKFDHSGYCAHLRENHKILINPTFENDAIRVVTHRDVSRE